LAGASKVAATNFGTRHQNEAATGFVQLPRRDRRSARSSRLSKKQHDIDVVGSNKYQWDALLMAHARERLKGYGVKRSADAIDLIAGYCRLLEESDLLVTGSSEIGAIRELCHRNNIPCPL
jgi:hypothetical protein